MEAAAVLCEGETIHWRIFRKQFRSTRREQSRRPRPKMSLGEIERQHILRVLSESPTLGQAAATLGINVTTLYRKRKRYNLDVAVGSKSR